MDARTCSGCGQERLLRKDGTIQAHRLPAAEVGWRKPCDGSRRPPRVPLWVMALLALAEGRIDPGGCAGSGVTAAKTPAPDADPAAVAGHHTLLCRDRADAAAGLREHGIDDGTVAELLDDAGLYGDAQSSRVRVNVDDGSWFVDLFGSAPGSRR